jgi:integrase
MGPMYRLVLLTGQRKGEVAGMRARELPSDLLRALRESAATGITPNWRTLPGEARIWTVPPERFKSNASHQVPLSDDALNLIAALPTFRKGDHLFTTTAGEKPVNGFSKPKARLDQHMLWILRAMARKRGDDPRTVSLPPFVIHDLRRTLRTRLSGLRVPEPVAEMVIGHGKRGLARVYDQHRYADEMREALDAWAAKLRTIVAPTPANVVPLKAVGG